MRRPAQVLLQACVVGVAAACTWSGPALAIDRIAWIEDLGLSTDNPLVTLPSAAGAVIGVDERRKIGSYTQVITLEGDAGTIGENQFIVTVTRDGLAPRLDQAAIFAEMAERLPDVPMTLGPSGTRNALGLFGFALGSKGGLTCVYGWQSVNLADHWITEQPATPFDERHALSIRVRLCRTSLGAERLVALLEGMQGGASGTQTTSRGVFGSDALSAAVSLGSSAAGSAEIPTRAYGRPTTTGFRSSTAWPRQAEQAHRHVSRRVRREASPDAAGETAPQPAQKPLAGMPSVPLPN